MMTTLEIIGGIGMILVSIAIILLVLMQESTKASGISSLTGGDSYYNKNQGRTMDALLFKATKFSAIFFFLLTLGVYAVNFFVKTK